MTTLDEKGLLEVIWSKHLLKTKMMVIFMADTTMVDHLAQSFWSTQK